MSEPTAGKAAEPWPTQLRLTDEGRLLTITFDSGEVFALSSRRLRVATPSAEARRLSPADREAQVGGREVRIVEIEPVGNYAIRPTFDDGHSTGIFTWTYLAQLGREAK
ncbi:MAG: gamma-butyrobetaine hydroxylase-like domain-containing protein [Roseiarcus sp.]